jgi:hypothetical protein
MSEAKYWEEREAAQAKALKKAAKLEAMSMGEVREYCNKLEKDRNYVRLKAKKRKIQIATLSLDKLIDSFEDPSEIKALSDNGAGRESILAVELEDEVADALRKLPENYRPFAEAVLQGKTWRDMGMAKRTFNWKLKKVENFLSIIAHTPQKLSLEN